MHELRFTTKVRVFDLDALEFRAKETTSPHSGKIADIIETVVVNAARAPLDSGFEIISKTATSGNDEETYHLTLHVRVLDEGTFVAEARARYADCWGDRDWLPETLGEAAYEILIASNGNADSPIDNGYEIVETAYHVDQPLSNSVANTPASDEPSAQATL